MRKWQARVRWNGKARKAVEKMKGKERKGTGAAAEPMRKRKGSEW